MKNMNPVFGLFGFVAVEVLATGGYVDDWVTFCWEAVALACC